MNSIIKKIVAAVVTVSLCSFGMAKASENETGVKFAVQSDLVSSYTGVAVPDRCEFPTYIGF